jgi:F420-non-reducing hydrogenase small subunit
VVGIVTGGVSNEEHLEVLEEMRKKCKVLIALGSCATQGGIPALMNGQDAAAEFRRDLSEPSTDKGAVLPDQGGTSAA